MPCSPGGLPLASSLAASVFCARGCAMSIVHATKRLSHEDPGKGRSDARQTERTEAYCTRHGHTLDTSLGEWPGGLPRPFGVRRLAAAFGLRELAPAYTGPKHGHGGTDRPRRRLGPGSR